MIRNVKRRSADQRIFLLRVYQATVCWKFYVVVALGCDFLTSLKKATIRAFST